MADGHGSNATKDVGTHFAFPPYARCTVTQPVLVISLFAFFSVLSWAPGNLLLRGIWRLVAKYPGKEVIGLKDSKIRGSSPFIRQVGGLERMLYIISVMSHRYELLAGWLVMKAFFGFMTESREPNRMSRQGIKTVALPPSTLSEDDIMARYNGMLIGNAVSLLIGLAAGASANFVFRLAAPADTIDIHLNAWLTSHLAFRSLDH